MPLGGSKAGVEDEAAPPDERTTDRRRARERGEGGLVGVHQGSPLQRKVVPIQHLGVRICCGGGKVRLVGWKIRGSGIKLVV